MQLREKGLLGWANLPEPLLERCLCLVEGNMYSCLTVCLSWFNTAQKLLYKDVLLHEMNLESFLNTIKTSHSNPGQLVKSICFSKAPKTDGAFTSYKAMETIAKHCSALTSIDMFDAVQDHWLPCVVAMDQYLKSLTGLCYYTTKRIPMVKMPLLLCGLLHYRDCIRRLCIYGDNLSKQSIQDTFYSHLFNFKSLTALTLSNCQINSMDLEKLINGCNKLVELRFQNTLFLKEERDNKIIKRQGSLSLSITQSPLTGATVSLYNYCTQKFLDLASVDIDLEKTRNDQASVEELLELGKLLDDSIFDLPRFAIKLQNTTCEEVRNRFLISYAHGTHGKHLTRAVKVNFLSTYKSGDGSKKSIKFIRTATSDELHYTFRINSAETKFLPKVMATIKSFAPDEVIINGLNFYGPKYKLRRESFYNKLLEPNKHGWSNEIFDNFDRIIKEARHVYNLDITLSNLLLIGPSPKLKEDIFQAHHFNKLSFKYSSIHHAVIPELSLRIPRINILQFYMCDITGHLDRRTFKIHLPYTTLKRLEIVLPTHYHNDEAYKYPELLDATSKKGYLLHLETDNKSFASFRSMASKVENGLAIISKKLLNDENPFVISIKCKDIENLVIFTADADVIDIKKEDF